MTRAPAGPGGRPHIPTRLRSFYESPSVPYTSGRERARRQATILTRLVADRSPRLPLRCLDVGCGDGEASRIAIEACAAAGAPLSIVGCDWSKRALRHARARGIEVARASLEPPGLPFASKSIDVVVMSELIEHLVDTDAALMEARRVLVPEGTLLLSTPNLAAWYNRALLAAGVQPVFSEVSFGGIYGRPGSVVAGHLRLFTRRAIVGLLRANGFSEVSVAGAPYHDTPWLLRPLDRLACRWPSFSSILLVTARRL